MNIIEILRKEAADTLKSMTIHVEGRPFKIQIQNPEKPVRHRDVAAKAVRSAAIGGAMAGGLPWAFLGFSGREGKTRLFGSEQSLLDEAINTKGSGLRTKDIFIKGVKNTVPEAVAKEFKALKVRRGLRWLALGSALAGIGVATYPSIKGAFKNRKMKKISALDPQTAKFEGKFKSQDTPSTLGAPGHTLKQQSVNPMRPIKDVLSAQANIESNTLLKRGI